MVLKIRLARWGARHNPFYGLVVANSKAARDYKHLERLGTYNPTPDEKGIKHIELNTIRIKYWLGVGAQCSERVAWLLSKASIIPPTPKYLHKSGQVDLNDSSTWTVRVADKDGVQLSVLSAADFAAEYPKDTVKLPIRRLEHTDITLDTRPKTPLSKQESLLVLQTYLGI